MNCCYREATEHHFDEAHAQEDLLQYQQEGPDKTTRILLDALKAQRLQRATLLDIGGGIGVIPHELLAEGVESATLVEMASSYIEVAENEAKRCGLHERITFVHGDFVELAQHLPQADLVTLDRVVCCYPDVEQLVASSAAKARTWYALSYPRDRWYVKVGAAYENWRRRRGDRFQTYIHPEHRIHALLLAAGFDRYFRRGTFLWQVAIYGRTDAA